MKNYVAGKSWIKFCALLLLGLILMACQKSGNSNSAASSQKGGDSESTTSARDEGDAANAELCKKIEACGCEKFTQCMQEAASTAELQKPGVRECMLKSSCQSLCAGRPDGCLSESGGGSQDAETAPEPIPQTAPTPQQLNCGRIRCSRNSDCPAGCSGGCGMGYCLSF